MSFELQFFLRVNSQEQYIMSYIYQEIYIKTNFFDHEFGTHHVWKIILGNL